MNSKPQHKSAIATTANTRAPKLASATHAELARGDFTIGPHDCRIVEEHGQEWAVCLCGAQFSISGGERDVNDYEQVSDGDEDYHNEAVQS